MAVVDIKDFGSLDHEINTKPLPTKYYYRVRVEKCNWVTTKKAPPRPMLSLELVVLNSTDDDAFEQEYSYRPFNRKIFDNLVVTDHEFSRIKLKNFAVATESATETGVDDELARGKECWVEVSIDGQYNRVKRYFNDDELPAGAEENTEPSL